MAEVDISPLAKRLAEENNVDWRVLRGTGDEGRVVERDVLDFLARVMSGEEDADPTPEPLPDGMEDWPDRAPGISSPPASWTAEATVSESSAPDSILRNDLENSWEAGDNTLLDVESAVDDWGGASTSTRSGQADSQLSDLEFGFDEPLDESDEGAAVDADERAVDNPLAASAGEPAIDEDIFVFDDSDDSNDSDVSAQEPASRSESEQSDSWADSPSFGAGGYTGRDPDFGSDFGAGFTSDSEGDDFFSLRGDEQSAAGDSDRSGMSGVEGGSTNATEFSFAAEAEAYTPAVDAEHTPWEGNLDELGDTLPDGVTIEEEEFRVLPATYSEQAISAEMPAVIPAEKQVIDPAEQPAIATMESPASRPTSARGVFGSGIVLRRDVDLTALVEARAAVAAELGLQESISPAGFLVRAAARAGRPWPLTSDDAEVGLASLTDDGVDVSVITGASTLEFRELMDRCAPDGGDSSVEPALVVADLSALGIDEAVLDLGLPVLTLGRVLAQREGSFHGTLTLSGPIAPDAGSRFLGRVVELLAAPVRLVL
ncbi:MAG: E3 binding domain-containing protein [Trueperaceae bacterium]